MERDRSENTNGTPECVHMWVLFLHIQCVSINVTGMLQGLPFCGERWEKK